MIMSPTPDHSVCLVVCFWQEFFQKDAMRLPELDGILYLKEGKKSWKKHYFVLRASGIYYTPKGKTKVSMAILSESALKSHRNTKSL